MTKDVFSTEHGMVTLFMAWHGRGESPAGIASRLLPTTRLLTGLYPEGRAGFVTLGGPGYNSSNSVPQTLEDLTEFALNKTDRGRDGEVFEKGRTRLTMLLSPDPSLPKLQSDAMLSVVAGTPLANSNYVSIQFEDSFPLGAPSVAAHWFLDLVRIWQPEYAALRTDLANAADRSTFAGYLSWGSAKAFSAQPDVVSAKRIPFGDGFLYAAREWTLDGFVAFDRDLAAVGGNETANIPDFQDPPAFPDEGYPEELDLLDDLVTLGP